MLSREEWLPLARKLDWDYTYVREDEVFPQVISGHPWLPHAEWKEWEESFKTSYREYVDNQYEKDMAVYAVRDAIGRLEMFRSWQRQLNSLRCMQPHCR
jgi:toluene monooxygenase system protein A